MSDIGGAVRALEAICRRELLRFVYQRERFFSALVRPLVWLIALSVGFSDVLTLPVSAPYQTYISYEVYALPGLIAMIQLFNGMQSSLSMVYDREMGSMRILLIAPWPREFLLAGKLLAGTLVSIGQVYAFLAVTTLVGVRVPAIGYVALLPTLVLTGMMFGAIGMLLSSTIRQLENFAGIMNFVIFPAFFFSSALYPLWKIQTASTIVYVVCLLNPFTYAVELIRYTLYLDMSWTMLTLVLTVLLLVFAAAARGYDPTRGIQSRVRASG